MEEKALELTNLITNEPDLMHIVRTLEKRQVTIEHNLGVMEWDSETQNMTYTSLRRDPNSIRVVQKLESKFR